MDTKDKLPPIPTPASQRWREFRIQVLPFVIFLGALVAIVFLWKAYVQPIGVIGFAETNQVNVTSINDGIVDQLLVQQFQTVTQGQVIAVVVTTDPRLLEAQTNAEKADLNILRERLQVDEVRVDQNYQQFKMDILRYRIDQAEAQSQLALRAQELKRAQHELASGVLSPAGFDQITNAFATLSAQIQERATALEALEKSVHALRPKERTAEPSSIDVAIEAKARELEVTLEPSILRAPISGMVSLIHSRQGERIIRGRSVCTIADPQARRVIGYIRQPVSDIPSTNDTVQILKRTAPRTYVRGKIENIGAQFELINPALLSTDTKRMEVGLPILVSVPAGFPLVPGEYVNLTIEYSR